jgi:hypothetical protein
MVDLAVAGGAAMKCLPRARSAADGIGRSRKPDYGD